MHNTWLEHALVQVYNLFMASKSVADADSCISS